MANRKLVNRSKLWLTTGEQGELLPIGLWEVLPRETISHRSNLLLRVTPMAAPVFHQIRATILHFFVPSRILWPKESMTPEGENWEDFITGGHDGTNSAEPPTIQTNADGDDLLDLLGLPPVDGIDVSQLPVRAVNKIWNYWMRDQDLAAERELDDISIPRVAWERDYFSTARPYVQRGPGVTIPLGEAAPLKSASNFEVSQGPSRYTPVSDDLPGTDPGDGFNVWTDKIFADLSAATGIDITDLRKASAVQRFQENRMRWGARYVEYTTKAFGARPLDQRLQEPELLGGGRAPIQVSEVIQTGPNEQGSQTVGMADLWGHGISAMRHNGYRYTTPEHGYIVSFLFVRPRAVYMQGIDRHWLKKIKEDFFQPELKHIGQQEVWNNEVFADPVEGKNAFGFQDRYSEYRFARNRVCREFRDVLKHWHMAREFESPPVLNESFVTCTPTKRIYNEQVNNPLWAMVQHQMRVLSPIGRNTEPRLI